MLRVLDAEAPVAPAVRPRNAVVDSQNDGVGAVANRVHGDLQARRVCRADPAAHVGLGLAHQAIVSGRVGERLEKVCRA